ncbi:murein DD-endopeptidase MepM/ murein hydrolase activator NlpD [Arthrobacter sp. UYCu712]
MGTHRGNPPNETPIKARTIAVRCLSGSFCLSLAVLTFGVQGLAGGVSDLGPVAAAVTGVVEPVTLDAILPAAPAVASVAADAPASFTADALALVGFSRSMVETSSELGGNGELNVASAGLKRPAPGSLMAPLESLQESSPYGLRTSPLTGTAGEFHWGQDYAAPCGTRVYSADAGVVRAVGWHPWGGGNRVEIDHGNGLITTYNHLEAIAVKKGDSVRVGEVIARVGTTGSSTGCHLHFETILNGHHTDPHGWSLLPTTQVDPLGTIDMTSYEPEAGKTSNASIGWAIPVQEDRAHEVTGGIQEKPVPPAAEIPSAEPTPSPTTPATPSTPTPGTPTIPVPPTPTPTPTTPAPAPTPTPTTPTVTPPPTPPTPPTPTTTTPTTTTPTTPTPTTPTPATPSTPAPTPPVTSTVPTTTAPPPAPTTVPAPVTSQAPPPPSISVAPVAPPAPVAPVAPSPGVTQSKKSPAVSTSPAAPAPGTTTASAAASEATATSTPTKTSKR